MQTNIGVLLAVEDAKRLSIEELKRQELEAKQGYQQAEEQKWRKESELKETEESLHQVKGQLKAEKFKSSAAEAGSALMDGISSALGTSKVKRQQQEIEELKVENQNLRQEVTGLNQQLQNQQTQTRVMQRNYEVEIDTQKQSHGNRNSIET